MQLIPLLINFTSFAQLQIKDKLRTFPRREGFTRNKRKSSALICLIHFLTLSQPSPPGARLRPAYGPSPLPEQDRLPASGFSRIKKSPAGRGIS